MELKNFAWLEDDSGPYWHAELWENGRRTGVTGSYYDVDENNRRASKDEQLATLADQGYTLPAA